MGMAIRGNNLWVNVADEANSAYISYKTRQKASTIYLDEKRKSFPIRPGKEGCTDLNAAIHAFGRYKGEMDFSTFKSKVTKMMKERGCSLPEKWAEEEKT